MRKNRVQIAVFGAILTAILVVGFLGLQRPRNSVANVFGSETTQAALDEIHEMPSLALARLADEELGHYLENSLQIQMDRNSIIQFVSANSPELLDEDEIDKNALELAALANALEDYLANPDEMEQIYAKHNLSTSMSMEVWDSTARSKSSPAMIAEIRRLSERSVEEVRNEIVQNVFPLAAAGIARKAYCDSQQQLRESASDKSESGRKYECHKLSNAYFGEILDKNVQVHSEQLSDYKSYSVFLSPVGIE